jgi:hypothetical protein
MKKVTIAALVAAQLGPCAVPARAAELPSMAPHQQESRMGAFAGAHLKIALGGEKRRIRGGLTLAPSLHGNKDGVSSLRIGEGLEYGFTDRQPAGLSLAGHRIGADKNIPQGRRQKVSTTGYIAIAAGTVLLVGALVFGWMVYEGNKHTE